MSPVSPRVAIVHDYLVNKGGAEKVVLALHRMYPDAPVFTALYHPETTYPEFAAADVRTSWLQRFSGDPGAFRRFLPLFGRAMSSLQVQGFDVVLASSAGFGHFVRPRGGCLIVYCHTPPRFLWDERYDVAGLAPGWARPALPPLLRLMRRADVRAARRAHLYLANSKATAARVSRVYGRSATIVYPPVETARFAGAPGAPGDYWMTVGRLLAHRNMHLAVRAFTAMGKRLVVVGDGPAASELRALAGPSIEFQGAVDDATLNALYAGSRGVVVPGEEDFGIVPLEANAAGKPVVALGKGGALETVVDGLNGVLFRDENVESLTEAVERAEALGFDAAVLRERAETYGEAAFASRIRAIVEDRSSCIECARVRRGGARETAAQPGNATEER